MWFVDAERRPVHLLCWIAAYGADGLQDPDAANVAQRGKFLR
jgi:hypothetical protein